MLDKKENIRIFMILMPAFLFLFCTDSFALSEDACTKPDTPRSTPSSEFSVIGDGSIVKHHRTGLEWQRCAFGVTWDGVTCRRMDATNNSRTWQDAVDTVADIGQGWRLPNVEELRSIVENCRTYPAINQVVFPNIRSKRRLWSATLYPADTGGAYGLVVASGNITWHSRTSMYDFLLVRDAR